MTEERKHAILVATVILTARRLQPLLEEQDREGKPNIALEFWTEVYTKKSMERAAHNDEINAVVAAWLPGSERS